MKFKMKVRDIDEFSEEADEYVDCVLFAEE